MTALAKVFERRFLLFLPVLTVVAMMLAFRMGYVVETFPNMAANANFSNILDIWFSEPLTRGHSTFPALVALLASMRTQFQAELQFVLAIELLQREFLERRFSVAIQVRLPFQYC